MDGVIGARVPVRYHWNNHMTYEVEGQNGIDVSYLEARKGELLNLGEKWVQDQKWGSQERRAGSRGEEVEFDFIQEFQNVLIVPWNHQGRGWQGRLFQSFLAHDPIKLSIQHQKLKIQNLLIWVKWLKKGVRHGLLSALINPLGQEAESSHGHPSRMDLTVWVGWPCYMEKHSLAIIWVLALLDHEKRQAQVLRL